MPVMGWPARTPSGSSRSEAENRALAQELRETRRANEILKKAAAYFAQAELDRPPK